MTIRYAITKLDETKRDLEYLNTSYLSTRDEEVRYDLKSDAVAIILTLVDELKEMTESYV